MTASSIPGATIADADLGSVIAAGATQLGLDLRASQVDLLVAYVRLIDRWNATYNLTAVRDPAAMATQHVVDSLAAIPTLRTLVQGDRPAILDVGSGAGLPGVVIAIAEPRFAVVCVDSVGKKAAFITHVAASLRLGNLAARHARVEDLTSSPRYDVIVSRAYAALADIVTSTRHLLAPGGWWLAMKGKPTDQEVAEAARLGVAFSAHVLRVPGLASERCLAMAQDSRESECSPRTRTKSPP